MFKQLIGFLDNLLFPPVCPFCEKILNQREAGICTECLKQLPFVVGRICSKCGKSMGADSDEEFCSDCRNMTHIFKQGRAVWKYDSAVRESILRFKYNDRKCYAHTYALWMKRYMGAWIQSLNIDMLVPVPAHKKRVKKRGYNQAELIAKELGRLMDICVQSAGIYRRKNTLPQKSLSSFERMKNMQDAFCTEGLNLKGRHILIVDDIYTTGVTVDSLTYALKLAGAAEVYFAAVSAGG